MLTSRLAAPLAVALCAVAGVLIPAVSHALSFTGSDGLSIRVEPVFGYEFARKEEPSFHVNGRFFYGIRGVVGYRLIAGELEYTRAQDEEFFPESNISTRDFEERAKLGLRSTLPVWGPVSALVRAGGEASRNRHEQSVSGVGTTRISGWKVRPYVGAGVDARVSEKFSLVFDVTVVVDVDDAKRSDIQASGAIAVRL